MEKYLMAWRPKSVLLEVRSQATVRRKGEQCSHRAA